MTGLNPQIAEIDIGVRELRTIKIYPLSMADQFKMTDAVVLAIQQFGAVGAETLSDEIVVEQMLSLIEENIDRILKLVLDDEEKVTMDELTNEQFSDICMTVFEVNYEGSIKKFKNLAGRVKMALSGMSQKQTEEKSP